MVIHPKRKQTFVDLVLKKNLRTVLESWTLNGGDPVVLLNKWQDENVSPGVLSELRKEFLS